MKFLRLRLEELSGLTLVALGIGLGASLAGWAALAGLADQLTALLGLAAWAVVLIFLSWGGATLLHRPKIWRLWRWAAVIWASLSLSVLLAAAAAAVQPLMTPLAKNAGGMIGRETLRQIRYFFPQYADLVQIFALPAMALVILIFALALPIGWRKIFFQKRKITPTKDHKLSPLLKNLQKADQRDGFSNPYSARDSSSTNIISTIITRCRRMFLKFKKTPTPSTQKKTDEHENVIPLNLRPPAAEVKKKKMRSVRSVFLPKLQKRQKKTSPKLPGLTLIQAPVRKSTHKYQTAASAEQLDVVLKDFNIKGEILDIRPGPVVTLFEFKPAPGIKSSRIIGLADDIARSMSALSARIAIIPGRNALGIEIPNQNREDVHLAHLVASPAYKNTGANLPLILGTTIGGAPVIADLASMPHLLVAGTTGSGKSVSINAMILSLLYRLHADECRMIMIDPKMLELSVYQDIPHLLAPVVTEPKKAVAALKWVVQEMEARYRKMSALSVRSIANYNQKISGLDETMPFIVVVVDEMADLMMVAGKEIEAAVQRLAQMARAAGIHIIAATQRPSVDVITGTIKANFPTRISFQVASRIDSRTILGDGGAEQLLGRGDMLFMMAGGKMQRIHAPFVSDNHVAQVAAFWRQQGPAPDYLEEITQETDKSDSALHGEGAASGRKDADDDLYVQAISIVGQNGRASTSFLQRKLQIGYNRAARLIERMEDEGIVSAPNHAGKRQILNISG